MKVITMKAFTKQGLALAALAALALAAPAKASPLLNLAIEASTTGAAGSYSSKLASAPASGSTLFYEVVATSVVGAINSNTAKTPNGTTDSVISLANFTLTTGGTFNTSTLQNNFNTGSGASSGTTGSNSLDIRAIELGFTENSDAPLTIDSGTMTVGSGFNGIGITGNTDIPVNNAGSLKVSGSPVAQSAASEGGSDPLVGYTAVSEATSPVPEPASLAVFGIGAVGLLARRRRTMA